MKTSVSPFVALKALVLLLALPLVSFSQEWSAEQKAVWKNVEAYWALDAAGNTAGFLEYFHADYVGWSTDDEVPGTKEDAAKFIGHGHKTSKTLVYRIRPDAIKVHGNVAIVHYHFSMVSKDSEGKEKPRSGRWTDVLLKQGEKWVLIGDHGGSVEKGD